MVNIDTLPINFLNINDNINEECMICKEELTSQQCYTLPECKHTYHTACLISWFRNGDNRCPYCGNKGINNKCQHNNIINYSRRKRNYIINAFESQYTNDLKKFMTSGPVFVQVLEGENAVQKNRDLMGSTNPQEAAPGTIRADFANSIDANAVHGSDSVESAKREIEYFFNTEEILNK